MGRATTTDSRGRSDWVAGAATLKTGEVKSKVARLTFRFGWGLQFTAEGRRKISAEANGDDGLRWSNGCGVNDYLGAVGRIPGVLSGSFRDDQLREKLVERMFDVNAE